MRGNLVLINSMCISSEITEEFQLFACEEKFPILADPNTPREIFVLGEDTDIKEFQQISENKNIYFYSLVRMPDALQDYFLKKARMGTLYSVMDIIINEHSNSPQTILVRDSYIQLTTSFRQVLADEKSALKRFRNRNRN